MDYLTRKTLCGLLMLTLLMVACQPLLFTPPARDHPTSLPTATTTSRPTKTPNAIPSPETSQQKAFSTYPCPDSEFTCVALTVPLNHLDTTDERTIEVVFALLPASGERKGMFVTVVGGPGGSGLSVADAYTSAFDASLTEHFDIVFFDQRGVGASGGLQCVEAATAFYRTDWKATTPQQEAALNQTAETFAQNCQAEMGKPEILPYLGTEQAIEDLDAFRQAMGDEKIWLYGESYGTQFAQMYTMAHPDRVAALILDGPVDLTLSGIDFLKEQARAFNDVLAMTLSACQADEDCAFDMGGDSAAAYASLTSKLAKGPLKFHFPLPSASKATAQRDFTLSDLETAVSGYLYSETARMILMRALAAYTSRSDLVPLARILYDALYLDPETEQPREDPTYSDAIYYGVECNDYDYGPAFDYLRQGDSIDASLPYFSSIFYGDLPCSFWPDDQYDPGRPMPLIAEGIPTLVMVGTADPATPAANARRIFSHLADGYLVVEEGGPHVLFGWGNECVDNLVTDFLVTGEPPAKRETSCPGVVISEYLPLPPVNAADFSNPLEILSSLDDEIYYLPEYYYWDMETPTSVGCPFGGMFSFEPSDEGEALTFTNCAFFEGFVVTGAGVNNYNEGTFTLDLSVTGLAEGRLTYISSADGSLSVNGTYDGQAVDLSQ